MEALSSLVLTPSFFAAAGLAAAVFLAILWLGTARGLRFFPATYAAAPPKDTVTFLFHDGELLDATPQAARLLGADTHLEALIHLFRRRFPDVDALRNVPSGQRRVVSNLPNDAAYLSIERHGTHMAVTLHDDETTATDRHLWMTETDKTSLIREMINNAPIAVWACDQKGVIVETNTAFRSLAKLSGRDMPFDVKMSDAPQSQKRLWIEDATTESRHWFDLSRHDFPDGTRVYFAADANAIVTAEIAQRNFVQTLTKTFAQLSIGLAIFDRHRQLALFNPALIDLTSLPADFLSSRPNLAAFFDQLRDRQIMPEPRNYRNWRDQLSDMITAARDGAYCETWTLPTGLTYRINGKPHPDGAVAFLFEDISAEITLTRRFRAELEQSQAVIDAIDSAIAVFSRSGVLTFANRAFQDLWQCSPDESFIELTIIDVSKIWQENCDASPVWGDLRDFVCRVEERTEWQDQVLHKTLGPLAVMAAPVTGGATLVQFTQKDLAPAPTAPAKRTPATSR